MTLTWPEIKKQMNAPIFNELKDEFGDPKNQTSFSSFAGGASLIYRFLKIKKESLEYENTGFLFFDNKCWAYDRKAKHFNLLDNGYFSILESLEIHLKNNNQILMSYTAEIEKLEDYLYERKVPAIFMDLWFDLKKDTARIERYFGRQTYSINEFQKWAEKQADFPLLDLTTFDQDVKFALSNTGAALSRLDSIYHYFSSIKNDKLNRNIYLLTLISGIFLPLNLIVGFFGMNTQGLFLRENPEGTLWVAYSLVGILLFALIGFNIFHLIDRFILRFFLGQSSLYQRLSGKVSRLEESFKIKI